MTEQEFNEALSLNRRPLLAYVYSCCQNLSLAEDIVQETLMTAHRKRESYEEQASFRGWLFAIARFVWLRHCEKKGIHARAMQYLHDHAETLFTPELYEEEDWKAEKRALQDCVSKLNAEDRSLIDSHFVTGQKYAQIAKQLNRSLSWVKVRMYRVRELLRRCVQTQISAKEKLA